MGDIVEMLRVPALEDRLGPEEINCVQVTRREDGLPYRDDPRSEVLVLGDSFLRIYERDEPGAAGLVAHLARELEQPLASIVSDGGAATRVRQELRRHPEALRGKKVVIWEFAERDIGLAEDGWVELPLPPP